MKKAIYYLLVSPFLILAWCLSIYEESGEEMGLWSVKDEYPYYPW